MDTRIASSGAHGSAAECTLRLAGQFGGAATVDLKKEIADPSTFGRIALGGSVYGGRVRKERGFTGALLKQIAKSKGAEHPCDGKTDSVTLPDEKIAAFARRMDADRTGTTRDAGDGD